MVFVTFIYYQVINLRKVKNAIDQYRINILLLCNICYVRYEFKSIIKGGKGTQMYQKERIKVFGYS
jgi:hypothetical protein